MKKLSLKSVYKNLLIEGILDQSTFLKKLTDIIFYQYKTDLSSESSKVTARIVDKIKETGLFTLTGKENKKARKKAEIEIAKDLRQLKGLDGSPISIKGIKPLYESIINYLETKGDVSIDDCLLAADYYMKDLYPYVSAEEKQIIDLGNFDFSIIFKRTKFYERYLEYKSDYILQGNVDVVYEDSKIKIVYPKSPSSFLEYASKYLNGFGLKKDDVGYCTFVPATWYSYNQRQYVMLMTTKNVNANDNHLIVSLKVKFDGEVNGAATCGRYNSSMGNDTYKYMSDKSLDTIKSYVNDFNRDRQAKIDAVSSEAKDNNLFKRKALEQINVLIDLNRFDEIKTLLDVFLGLDKYDTFLEVSKTIYNRTKNNEYMPKVLEMYSDVIAEYGFLNNIDDMQANDDVQTSTRYYVSDLNKATDKRFVLDVYLTMLEKACDKRSHERYFTTILKCESYDQNSEVYNAFKSSAGYENNLKKAFASACNTRNLINFKTILKLIVGNFSKVKKEGPITILLQQPDSAGILFNTRGFFEYITDKKLDILTHTKMVDTSKNPSSQISNYYSKNYSPTEIVISEMIRNNKELFIESFLNLKSKLLESYKKEKDDSVDAANQEELERNIKKLSELETSNIDLRLIITHIKNATNYNLELIDPSVILEDSMFLQESDVENIVSDFLTNIDYFKMLLTEDEQVGNSLLDFIIYFPNSKLLTEDTIPLLAYYLQTIDIYSLSSPLKLLNSVFDFFRSNNINIEHHSEIRSHIVNIVSRFDVIKQSIIDVKYQTRFLQNIDYYIILIEKYMGEEKENILDNISSALFRYKDSIFLRTTTVSQMILKLLATFKNFNELEKINDEDNKLLLGMFIVLNRLDNEELFIKVLRTYLERIIDRENKFSRENVEINEKFNLLLTNRITASDTLLDVYASFVNPGIFHYSVSYKGSASSLFYKIINRLNNEGKSFNKNKVSEIIVSGKIQSMEDNNLRSILKNFMTISSEGDLNYLTNKDTVIVRNSLRSLFHDSSLSSTTGNIKSIVIELLRSLNRQVRIKISDFVFPELRQELGKETEEEFKARTETLIRKYIRLMLS